MTYLQSTPKTIYSGSAIDLHDGETFMITEATSATVSGIGYEFIFTTAAVAGQVVVELYQDSGRTEKVFEHIVDITDATTWKAYDSFGFSSATTGTLWGKFYCSGVTAASTATLTLWAQATAPSSKPNPVSSPYGSGIEDDGTGKPRVALATNSGLEFSTSKVKIKPDTTAAAYLALGAGGASVTGAVDTTTAQDVAGIKRFDSVGFKPRGTAGPPTSGSWSEGVEVMDLNGVKWRYFDSAWEMADVVTEYPDVVVSGTLAYTQKELLKIPVTGNVGQCFWLRVWARRASLTTEMQVPFRARIYETSDVRGRELVWQGLGLARQTYLTVELPASQTYLEVNSNDIAEVDELLCVYEDDNRFELGRCSSRTAGKFNLDEALVDADHWDVNSLVIPVTEWHNVPWINRDGDSADQYKILLEVRHDGTSSDPDLVFYAQVLAQSRGVIR
jgi:hypothetical protein